MGLRELPGQLPHPGDGETAPSTGEEGVGTTRDMANTCFSSVFFFFF